MTMKYFVSFLFVLFAAMTFAAEPEWNQFRGPNHDNKSTSIGLLKSWPKEGPKLLWKVDNLGEGYSGLSFFGDKIFTMGDIGDHCVAMALDKSNGKSAWTSQVGPSGAVGRYIGPRSTPAVDGKKVFAYSQFGDFVCFDAESGKELWGGDVVTEFGGRYMNNWGFASSPIFDGDNVILPVGGEKGTVIAFDKNGARKWRSKELTDDAPYSSAVPATIDGVKQLLLLSVSGVVGIDSATGKILWKGTRPGDRAVCSDPVNLGNIVFVSSAYNIGSHGFQIVKDGDQFRAEKIYEDPQLQNHHGGLILVGDHVYFTTNRELVCLEIKTGKVAWKNRCVGKGSLTFADGNLIVRAEGGDGTIVLVEANPSEYREKGRFDQPSRSDKNSWTYPVVVDGKLYIRDQNLLLCYELKP